MTLMSLPENADASITMTKEITPECIILENHRVLNLHLHLMHYSNTLTKLNLNYHLFQSEQYAIILSNWKERHLLLSETIPILLSKKQTKATKQLLWTKKIHRRGFTPIAIQALHAMQVEKPNLNNLHNMIQNKIVACTLKGQR